MTDDATNESSDLLRTAEKHFEQLVARVRDYAIFLLDPMGRVRSWNTGAEKIKGYSAAEIIGQSFTKFYPPEVVATGFPKANQIRIGPIDRDHSCVGCPAKNPVAARFGCMLNVMASKQSFVTDDAQQMLALMHTW